MLSKESTESELNETSLKYNNVFQNQLTDLKINVYALTTTYKMSVLYSRYCILRGNPLFYLLMWYQTTVLFALT